MEVNRDRKGKYFTDVIRKHPLRARLRTADDLIEGTIHIHPNRRPLDELNESTGFIAVTEASVHALGKQYEAEFIALNVDRILWMQPLEEEGADHD